MKKQLSLICTLIGIFISSPVMADVIAYWRFENNLNATTGNDLTYAGASTNDFSSSVPLTAFSNTGAYEFDGNTDKLTTSLNINGFTEYTFEFFMKPTTTSPSGRMAVISKPGLALFMDLIGPGVIVATINNGSNFPFSVDNSYTTEWQHVAAVYNGSNPSDTRYTIYVDGIEVALIRPGILPSSVADDDELLMLGNFAPENRAFSGLLDEVRISDVALDPSGFLLNETATIPEANSLILLFFCGLLFYRQFL